MDYVFDVLTVSNYCLLETEEVQVDTTASALRFVLKTPEHERGPALH
jgi:hypothetical protein